MLFNSFQFLIFFPLVTGLYFVLPHRFRWAMLLAASCFFYMAFIPVYILILLLTILIDYFAALWIEKAEGRKKKIYLIVSIISTCLVLFIFKYFNFFNSSFAALASFLHWNYPVQNLGIILPIGLSFHTFQSLSYVVEVYRGHQKAERHFGIYSLYVMFFPQLVAGPIERPQNLLHQFYEKHDFNYARVTHGLKLMAWGMFKKVVIADRLAILVNQIYNNPHDYTGIPLILATYFFAFQIYCDFSGYSDIAIGSAEVLGFKLMTNFNRPYFSKSIAEFWKRWHISLSTWFRDYLYVPLGGNRAAKPRWLANLFIVFLVSGLWHGANWTYVVWGALHGFYLIFGILTAGFRRRFRQAVGLEHAHELKKWVSSLVTFHLVVLSWIFFRAKTLPDAFYILSHLFVNFKFKFSGYSMGLEKPETLIGLALIGFLLGTHFLQRHVRLRQFVSDLPAFYRWSVYYAGLLITLFFGYFHSSDFIYFQF